MEVSHLELRCQISSVNGKVASYPHVVCRDQRRKERDVSWGRVPVLLRLVGSHVDDRVNIGLSKITYQKQLRG